MWLNSLYECLQLTMTQSKILSSKLKSTIPTSFLLGITFMKVVLNSLIRLFINSTGLTYHLREPIFPYFHQSHRKSHAEIVPHGTNPSNRSD